MYIVTYKVYVRNVSGVYEKYVFRGARVEQKHIYLALKEGEQYIYILMHLNGCFTSKKLAYNTKQGNCYVT